MFTAGSLVSKKNKEMIKDGDDMNRMVKHPFEGDGGVVAITFYENESNNITMRFCYIYTNGFVNENRKRRKLYNAMESTRSESSCRIGNDSPLSFFRHHLQPGQNKQRKNTSNARTIY